MKKEWNHNIHYHSCVLSAVPSDCEQALDVGCGQGLLARRISTLSTHLIGIDTDPAAIHGAATKPGRSTNVSFVVGDVMTYPFAEGSFDFISVVATLHHLPLQPALVRLRSLLKPGGVLVVVGLYRQYGWVDHLFAAAALPANWIMRRLRSFTAPDARLRRPETTLPQISSAARACLPGSVLRRQLFFRYSLVWRKPEDR